MVCHEKAMSASCQEKLKLLSELCEEIKVEAMQEMQIPHRLIIHSRYLAVTYVQHYNDVIIGAIASQITSLTIVYSAVYSDAD